MDVEESLKHFEELGRLYPVRLSQLRKDRENSLPPIGDVVKESEAWTLLAQELLLELTLSGKKAVANVRDGISADKVRDEELGKTFELTQKLTPDSDLDTLRKQIRGFYILMRLCEVKVLAESSDAMVVALCRLLRDSDDNVLIEIISTLLEDFIRLFTEPPAFSFIRDEIEKISEILEREERAHQTANAYIQKKQDYSMAVRTWCVLAIVLTAAYQTFPEPAPLDVPHAVAECNARYAAIVSKLT